MRKNKHGFEYTDPAIFKKKCVIKDKGGYYYHPTKAPEGLSKCGVMLQLNTKKEPHIFEARARAIHAVEHTIKFLKLQCLPFDPQNFIIEVVG